VKKHTRIYLTEMGYDETDWIMCEVVDCGCRAVDIHHINARGMGGSESKDTIENLMALCRSCHIELGDRKSMKDYLIKCHQRRMYERNVNSNRPS